MQAYSRGLVVPATLFIAAMFNPIAGISFPTPAFADEAAPADTQAGEAEPSNSPAPEEGNENIPQDGQASAENQNANPANETGNETGAENNTVAGQEEDSSSNVSSNENTSEERTATDSAQHFLSSQSKKSTLSKTTASKAKKAGNLDNIIDLGSSIKVIAISDTTYKQKKPIYKLASQKSEQIYHLQGHTCVICDTSTLKKGVNYNFVPVLLPNTKYKTGYVYIGDFQFGKINTNTFNMPKTTKKFGKRRQVCLHALSLLGTRYPSTGKKGLNCWEFAVKCYNLAGISKVKGKKLDSKTVRSVYNLATYGKKRLLAKKRKAGDLVFYPDRKKGKANGHVGIYLGNGYVIHSTCDKGNTYPSGGVHITRLTFRADPQQYRTLF